MKNTIFHELTLLYTIKYPCTTLPFQQFFPAVENLARSFYQHYFKNILKTEPPHPFVLQGEDLSGRLKNIYD